MCNLKIFLIFEKNFIILKNQLEPYQYDVKIETLEVLINQLINSETIRFCRRAFGRFTIDGTF